MLTKPWWETSPERLEWEFEWLRHKGFSFKELKRDASRGTLEIIVDYPWSGKTLALRVVFPCSYPLTRFEIFAADLSLRHHQNPYSKVLCLLGRKTGLWSVKDSVASFLDERMQHVLLAGDTDSIEVATPLEEDQAEPGSTYLQYCQLSVMLIDGAATCGDKKSGRFSSSITSAKQSAGIGIRGIVNSIDEVRLNTPEESVIEGWGFRLGVQGRWFRVSKYTPGCTADEFLTEVEMEHPSLRATHYSFEIEGRRAELFAFLVPDEHQRRVIGESWIFIVRLTIGAPGRHGKAKRQSAFVRASKIGATAMQARTPELRGLSEKTIAVIGLGCIGAPSAIEFARDGVGELRIMDLDVVDAGTTVRWPLGLSAVGNQKVNAVSQFISQNYPFTKVVGSLMRMGAIEENGGITLSDCGEFLRGVDLIFDAAAETGVSTLLSRIAHELGIPLICISATHGGWGGMVAAIEPGHTGCYECLMRHLWDHTIPTPPESPEKRLEIVGCAEPTFTAANFDTSEISLAGVRSAVSLLLQGRERSYPNTIGRVGILSLRDASGQVTFPRWESFRLQIHPRCPLHDQLSG